MTRTWRKALVLTGLGAAIWGTLVTAGPAGAMPVPERALTAVPVTTGSLRFAGDGWIGQATDFDFSTAAGSTLSMTGQGGFFSFTASGNGHGFSLDLRAPSGAALAVGTYVDAARSGFQAPGKPGFDLSGDGQGCNQERAEFTIHRITMDATQVIQALDATFVQHCEDLMDFVRGRVVVNFDDVPAESQDNWFALNGGDAITTGGFGYRTTSGDAVRAHLERSGNSIYVLARRPNDIFLTRWNLWVAAPTGQVLTAGSSYTGTAKAPGSGRPGLSLTSLPYTSCGTETGTFNVNKLHVAPGGVVDLLDLVYQRTCDGSVAAVGRVLVNTAAPSLTTTVAVAATGSVRTTKGLPSAIVKGTVTCSDWARYTISGTVSQTVDGVTTTKPFTSTTVDCNTGTLQWTALVPALSFPRFHSGPATVTATATPHFAAFYNPPPATVSTSGPVILTVVTNPLPPRRPGLILGAG